MAHFPSTFHVKPDLSRGEVRLSIQMSEARVDEWWIPGSDVREVLALEGEEGWRGEGSLRVRFNRGTADVAVYDTGGKRTTVRSFPSAVKLLLAQLRAAVSDLPERPVVEERVVVKESLPDEGIIREAVRSALQDEIGMMRSGVIDALKIELQRIEKLIGAIEVAPVVSVQPQAPERASDDTPMFIPSSVGKGAVEGSIKTGTKKAGGVDAAAKALRARKGKKK